MKRALSILTLPRNLCKAAALILLNPIQFVSRRGNAYDDAGLSAVSEHIKPLAEKSYVSDAHRRFA
jgi:hypothetical protein